MKRKELLRKVGLWVMAGSLSLILLTTTIQPTYGLGEEGFDPVLQCCEICGLELIDGICAEDPLTTTDGAETLDGSDTSQGSNATNSDGGAESGDTSSDSTDDATGDQGADETEVPPIDVPVDSPTDIPVDIPADTIPENPVQEPVVTPPAPPVLIPDVPADALAPRTPTFRPSNPFINMEERTRFQVDAQIEGLPAFIDLEMIVGALKTQDEFGYPASVTIAQIIQESGFGRFGPTAEQGEGLSYLAYRYNNLFGIKGEGTIGQVFMPTNEMNANGELYRIEAGFRVYNTFTESILDRAELIERVYSDLIEGVEDANTFAMQIARRWATDRFYGLRLIRAMERFDLYRLDEMTLGEFSEKVGFFANPVPGAVVTSPFGWRLHPIWGESLFHAGIDLGTNGANLPIYAARCGVVTFVGYGVSAGNWIEITHGNGLVTKYMHNAMNLVTLGQEVVIGQQIGIVGSTGNSTGPHLHFQVEMNGVPINPMQFLDFPLSNQSR